MRRSLPVTVVATAALVATALAAPPAGAASAGAGGAEVAEPGWAVSTTRPEVALTFDDGPDPRYTPEVLSILGHEHVAATFFVLGASARRHPALVRREVELGHEVGCHGWDHRAEMAWSRARTVAAFRACARAVEHAAHRRPHLVRPPYGLLRSDQVAALARAGFFTVTWDVSGAGMAAHPARIPIELARVRPGDIILLHDGRGRRTDVVRSLPSVLRGLRRRGLYPVTLHRLALDGTWRFDPEACARARLYAADGFVPHSILRHDGCQPRAEGHRRRGRVEGPDRDDD